MALKKQSISNISEIYILKKELVQVFKKSLTFLVKALSNLSPSIQNN